MNEVITMPARGRAAAALAVLVAVAAGLFLSAAALFFPAAVLFGPKPDGPAATSPGPGDAAMPAVAPAPTRATLASLGLLSQTGGAMTGNLLAARPLPAADDRLGGHFSHLGVEVFRRAGKRAGALANLDLPPCRQPHADGPPIPGLPVNAWDRTGSSGHLPAAGSFSAAAAAANRPAPVWHRLDNTLGPSERPSRTGPAARHRDASRATITPDTAMATAAGACTSSSRCCPAAIHLPAQPTHRHAAPGPARSGLLPAGQRLGLGPLAAPTAGNPGRWQSREWTNTRASRPASRRTACPCRAGLPEIPCRSSAGSDKSPATMSPMNRTRIKICGIRDAHSAMVAAACGADAIGLIFVAKSPRYITLAQAREIVGAMPPFMSAVPVFVDATVQEIMDTAGALKLRTVQLHGKETPDMVEALAPLQIIKALSFHPRQTSAQLDPWRHHSPNLAAILLDAPAPAPRSAIGLTGGLGLTFDWPSLAELERAGGLSGLPPVILAGGLNPQNVGQAIRTVHPYAVDVSTGVESQRGVKDHARIAAFCQAVAAA